MASSQPKAAVYLLPVVAVAVDFFAAHCYCSSAGSPPVFRFVWFFLGAFLIGLVVLIRATCGSPTPMLIAEMCIVAVSCRQATGRKQPLGINPPLDCFSILTRTTKAAIHKARDPMHYDLHVVLL